MDGWDADWEKLSPSEKIEVLRAELLRLRAALERPPAVPLRLDAGMAAQPSCLKLY